MEEMIKLEDTGIQGMLVSVENQYCSFNPTTQEQKAALFKAMNNPEKRLSDMINMVIEAKDLYMELVTIVDQNSGELIKAPRIVIIDNKGIGYQCVSKGVFGSIKKLISLYGEPTWKVPIKLKIKQVTTRKGLSTLTFELE